MFTCAVTWHGALYTWGSGARGQLGTGSLQESWDRSVFVPVAKSGNRTIFLKRTFFKGGHASCRNFSKPIMLVPPARCRTAGCQRCGQGRRVPGHQAYYFGHLLKTEPF